MILQHAQGRDGQNLFMGGGQDHGRGNSRLQGLHPARGAKAPAIPGFQTRKAELRTRGGEIIAGGLGEDEEILGHHRADGVHAGVLRPCLATAIAVEAGQGGHGARLKLAAQDIARAALVSDGHGDKV